MFDYVDMSRLEAGAALDVVEQAHVLKRHAEVARVTGDLTLRKALWVDATIAPLTTRLAPGRLLTFVEALVVEADAAAAEERWAARNSTKVEIGVMGRDGLRDIYGWLTADDATCLDAALEQLSSILAGQGSVETAAERRATALGILATPARTLVPDPAVDSPTRPAHAR